MATDQVSTDRLIIQDCVSMNHDHNILDHAQNCWQLLERGQALLPKTLSDTKKTALLMLDYKSDFEQFRVWTKNLGVFAPDALSADYRLRDAADVRESICGLLDSISNNIKRCLQIVQSTHTEFDRLSILDLDDSESSISTDSRDSKEADEPDQRSLQFLRVLTFLIENNSDLVEKLLRISIAIRKSGIKARTLRADAWEDKNKNVGHDDISKASLEMILEKRYGLSDALKLRVCLAIIKQRHRLLYTKAHQSKLSFKEVENPQPAQRATPSSNASQTQEILGLPPIGSQGQSSITRSHDSKFTHYTEATRYTKINLEQVIQRSVRAASTSSSRSYVRKAAIPPPPPIKPGLNYFECPYCYLLLPREKADSRSEWRQHVISDLCPFVCVDPACSMQEVQFEKEAEWFEHHKKFHAQQWWCDGSDPPHEPQVFDDKEAFINHIRSLHSGTYTDTQIQQLAHVHEITKDDPFTSCPFCDQMGSSGDLPAQANIVAQYWRGHISNHLIDIFATFALPDRDDLEAQLSDRVSDLSDRSTLLQLDGSTYDDTIVEAGVPSVQPDRFDDLGEDVGDNGGFVLQWDFLPDRVFNMIDPVTLAFSRNMMQAHSSDVLPATLPEWMREQFTDRADQDYDSRLPKDAASTGSWLLYGSAFREWLHSQNSYLSLHGPIGCGKTILCDKIFEYLNVFTIGPFHCLFGFKHDDKTKQTLKSAIEGLLSQLIPNLSVVDQTICDELAHISSSTEPPPLEISRHLLDTVLRASPRTYFILDGLEQCSDQELLTDFIKDMVEYPGMHLLCTTRRPSFMFDEQTKLAIHHIDITPEMIETDVREYVNTQVDMYRAAGTRISDPRFTRIIEQIIAETSGMFEYTHQRLAQFQQCSDDLEIDKERTRLPLSLCSRYEAECNRFLDQSHQPSIMALQFLTYSKRKLYAAEFLEICCFPKFEPSISTFKSESERRAMLIDACSTLVSCKKTTEKFNPLLPHADWVEFAHPSMKRYFSSPQSPLERQSAPWNGQQGLALVCLRYLLRLANTETLGEDSLHKYPFASYAAQCWWRHARAHLEDLDRGTTELAFQLLTNESSFLMWLQLYDPESEAPTPILREVPTDIPSPLYCAALMGLKDVFHRIHRLSGRLDLQYRLSLYGNILQAACYGGSTTIVTTILAVTSDANVEGGIYGSALEIACRHGYTNIVLALIAAGADVNSQKGIHGSALEVASGNGHTRIVSALLTAGANANGSRGRPGRPLHIASQRGRIRIIRLLLEAGADIDASYSYSTNALRQAIDHGQDKTVQFLLENGADVESGGVMLGTALHHACDKGHENIVKILVDSGADVGALSLPFGSSLAAAVQSGNSSIVKMLLVAGAKVKSVDRSGNPVLIIAARNGSENIVRELMRAGANFDTLGINGESALVAAAKGQYSGVVKQLLSAGANPNNDVHRQALLVASTNENEQVVKMLVDAGADINFDYSWEGTVLIMAAARGHEEIVRIFLNAGADVNIVNRQKNSALTLATIDQHESVVKLLLAAGAQPYHNSHKSALLEASRCGNVAITKMLIDAGGDVNHGDVKGMTALMIAAVNRDEVITKLLLDAGPDLNLVNKEGASVLTIAIQQTDGYEGVVRQLLDAGLRPDDYNHRSALIAAVEENNVALVGILLDEGANPAAYDHDGRCALVEAANPGQIAALRLLLKERPSPDNEAYKDALEKACEKGNLEAMETLLSSVDITQATTHEDVMSLAIVSGKAPIVRALLSHVAGSPASYDLDHYLEVAAKHGHKDVIQELTSARDLTNEPSLSPDTKTSKGQAEPSKTSRSSSVSQHAAVSSDEDLMDV